MMNIDSKIYKALAEIAIIHELSDVETMSCGHTGAFIYRCKDRIGGSKVIKIGSEPLARKEIQNNIAGYRGIASAGAADIIPYYVHGEVDDFLYLLLTDLGNNVSESSKAGTLDFTSALASMHTLFRKSISADIENFNQRSLQYVAEETKKYFTMALHKGMNAQAGLRALNKISFEGAYGDRSACFIADFTPDNLFFKNNNILFIDPWEQPVYRGACMINISQFKTLSTVIYDLPGSLKAASAYAEVEDGLGEELGLSDYSRTFQLNLGASLQYGLSAYNRFDTEPEYAQHLLNKGMMMLTDLL
ncbi:MAG: hypothetical protein QFB86_01215 [Patescibacteria group bacterium]|nr:hypothetical protein [Patescibacteria group bacterium]